jgi:hypothetical protein
MTNYAGLNVDNVYNNTLLGSYDSLTISGTLTDGTNPLIRQILVIKHPFYSAPYVIWPDEYGDWTITINGNIGDKILIIALGNLDEKNAISNWVTLEA